MTSTLILGAGLAGWTVARELRRRSPDAAISMVTADDGDFYAKPSLSNAFARRASPQQLVGTPGAAMAEQLNVRLVRQVRARGIDTGARLLRLEGGGSLPFDDLVLASGARAIPSGVAGSAADQVLSVNSLGDFGKLYDRLQVLGPDRADGILIMGAGLIGCEFANDLAQAGYAVTVVEPGERPLASLLPPAASEALRDALGAAGVRWRFGTKVAAVDRHGHAAPDAPLQVTLSDGSRLDAGLVLSAIGLRPDLGLASSAGLACRRGILVDRLLRTSHPRVHALGDCAEYVDDRWEAGGILGEGRLLPYVMPLMSAARALAATLAGDPSPLALAAMPVIVKTPALPLVVVPPEPGQSGAWSCIEDGVWTYLCAEGGCRGFVLAGATTSRRAAMMAGLAPR
ncbi:MAG TPA: FAD-dependent oxidoreductase [Noviherbaspirillum sp.]|jgi:rubredoxin-NAD+ reductase|uniref:NAD(P)/FAD-dependent oxidoreductase n=1 Tax=Noviherbaspirillum sp. TaxID=1926288 RepID=UPI002F9232F9